MGKVWNFEGNGVDNLTPLKELISEYRDGLNSQQEHLKASFKFGADLERVVPFVDFFIDQHQIFRVESQEYGYEIAYNIVTQHKRICITNGIKGLEKYLDALISSDEMGNKISHLTRVKKFIHNNTVY
jgi:hypothetical protein